MRPFPENSVLDQESKLKKKHRKILAKLEEIQGELNCHYYFDVKINCGIPVLSNYIEERLNARQVVVVIMF